MEKIGTNSCIFAVVSSIMLVLLMGVVAAEYTDTGGLAQNVNDCGSLTTANAIYTLTANVSSNSSCFTILANNITVNGAGYTINYSANSTYGHAFNMSSVNGTSVSNAKIVEINSTTNAKYAFMLFGAKDSYIYNNTINVSGTGTYGFYIRIGVNQITSSNNTLYGNTINTQGGSAAVGVGLDGAHYNNLTSNNITATTNNGQIGITLSQGSSHNIIHIVNITTASHGISLTSTGTTNNTFSNLFIRTTGSNRNAFQLAGTNHNFTVINSVLNSSGATGASFSVGAAVVGGMWNFTNVTQMDGSSMNVTWAAGGNGTLNYGWYLQVNASNYTNSEPLVGANVTVTDKTGIFQFSTLTSSDGLISKQILLEYSKNESASLYFSNYTVNVSNSSYLPYSNSSINMTRDLLLHAGLARIPEIYPTFSNLTSNSGSLTSSGLATFNVTVENTNGTVLLQINGVNYTATNLSAYGYNASVTLSSAGSYAYKWISWGSSGLNNLNSSNASYTVNAAAEEDDDDSGAASNSGTTYVVSTKQLDNGYNRRVGVSTRMRFSVENEPHSVRVDSITSNSMGITVNSTPQKANISVGETKKFEINGDDYYDLEITLHSVFQRIANITLQTIHEDMYPSQEATTEGTEETSTSEPLVQEEQKEESSGMPLWGYILIVIIVIVALFAHRDHRKKKKFYGY